MNDHTNDPAIRVLMMPRDTNPAGTIFGGVILSYLDQAGAEAALLHGGRKVVTVAMKDVVFREPVFIGDLVSFYADLLHIGKTSLRVKVLVQASRGWDRTEVVTVTEAEITYVNVDDQGKPTPIRPREIGDP